MTSIKTEFKEGKLLESCGLATIVLTNDGKYVIKEAQLKTNEHISLVELDHPNIIKCVGCERDDDNIYIKMPYYQKRDTHYIHVLNDDPMTEKQLRNIAKQIISAYLYAAKKGYHHGDIKPENILVTDDDNYILCDFGSAIRKTNLDNPGLTGTPMYAAPEVYRHGWKPVSDVWSLGSTLMMMYFKFAPQSREQFIDHFKTRECPKQLYEFLNIIFVDDPTERAKMFDLQFHPWLTSIQPKKYSSFYSIGIMLTTILLYVHLVRFFISFHNKLKG